MTIMNSNAICYIPVLQEENLKGTILNHFYFVKYYYHSDISCKRSSASRNRKVG